MPFPLTLTSSDGSAPQVLQVPTSWADVTLAQFIQLFAAGAEGLTVAEVLCHLPAGALADLDLSSVAYLTNLIAFAEDPADVLALLPTPGLPDIGSLPYGIFLLAQQGLSEAPDRPWLAFGPRLLALYRVQLMYGKYDEARVAACEAALLAAPVTESYADAAFFLSSYKAWRSGTPPTRKTKTPPTKKSRKQALLGLRKGSAPFSAWIRRLAVPS